MEAERKSQLISKYDDTVKTVILARQGDVTVTNHVTQTDATLFDNTTRELRQDRRFYGKKEVFPHIVIIMA